MIAYQISTHQSDSIASNMAAIHLLSSCEINTAMQEILSSEIFKRAHRMCRLLRYLVEQTLCEGSNNVSEYVIGVDVFDRDPSSYSPCEDPVVRVQMGRLRERLKSYYASLQHRPPVRVSIPLGSYEPIIVRSEA